MSSDLTRINTNVSALNALNALKGVNNELSDRQLRLSTGKRINQASDDAAGWVIGKTLESRSRGLGVAINNVGDASNLLSIAEGGLNSVLDVLLEMRDKIIQAASDTLGASERGAIDDQLADLANEIDSIVTRTQFNNVPLIDGTYQSKTFQVGAEATDTLSVSITQDHKATTLKVGDSDLVVDSAANASTALASVTAAISLVNSSIRSLGSVSARLSVTESSLQNIQINTEAAKSRILDADLAAEQLEAVKLQILQQTATAALAQANSNPQAVLSLFQ